MDDRKSGLVRLVAEALESQSELPLSLAIAWDAVGTSSWESHDDARDMLEILAYVDRRAAVAGACACARTVLRHVPAGELRPLRAIETAEAWLEGKATSQDAHEAANASWYAHCEIIESRRKDMGDIRADYRDVVALDRDATDAILSASHACFVAYESDARLAASTAYGAAGRESDRMSAVHEQLQPGLADVVRSVTACPTLAKLTYPRKVA